MGRGTNGGQAVADLFLGQWPSLILLPAVLCLIGVLATITRWWDRRDQAHLAGNAAAPQTVAAAVGSGSTAAPRPRTSGRSQRRWLRRTTCSCSWHTTGVGTGGPSVRGGPMVRT